MTEMVRTLDLMYARVWREGDLDAAFFRDWIDQWEDPESDWTLEQTRADTVLALVTTRGRGWASGVPVELRFAQVWTFRDGEPARMVLYADAHKGRRAAS